MDEGGQRIRRLAVQQYIQFHQARGAVADDMIVEGGIALRDALELVVEVEDYLRKRHVVVEFDAVGSDVVLAHQCTAFVQAELHHGAEEFGLGDNLRTDIGLLDMVD